MSQFYEKIFIANDGELIAINPDMVGKFNHAQWGFFEPRQIQFIKWELKHSDVWQLSAMVLVFKSVPAADRPFVKESKCRDFEEMVVKPIQLRRVTQKGRKIPWD